MAECTGLENQRAFTGTVGSNPTLSANFAGARDMPIYRYTCENCDHEFEKILPISKREHSSLCCPECGCVDIHRIISRSNFSLKGGGWYKDGYQKGKPHETD